ncbi:hypothetical protein AC622_04245 [Bacillus sp. FJAT-27916]|uniref:TVP38/TMEM64 family protein n=1 Tax=Bacillus sp. FJAT-27916 TaxID=1679169 RepID=UPI00067084C2|nr:VTT domain-containing protein [Bacillus sp. FJAT-27916]KMY43539.1 hypothetical protein AC622_04245 [Bacillus sp. FJAT-27916]
MGENYTILLAFIESAGYMAPVIFVLFHVLRQLLFIPVAVVCLAGGMLFGPLLGSILSLIGLWLSSVVFYFMINQTPSLQKKLERLDEKTLKFGGRINVFQACVLRLIPFIHFQLLNFYLMGNSRRFSQYAKAVFWTNVPLAFFYTIFGHSIASFSIEMGVIILVALAGLIFFMREKKVVIKWSHFFSHSER